MIKLTTQQIIILHEMLISKTGGLSGIRDLNLLESAVHTPFSSFDGNKHNLNPVFIYPSYSSTENKPKFRIAFVTDQVITDTKQRGLIIETLISLFDQSDQACKNADGIFFGTNQKALIVNLDNRISLEQIKLAHKPKIKKRFKDEDSDLETLRRDFDFLSYLEDRNGEIFSETQDRVMFEDCEICDHHRDLVFYKSTNSFYCFSSSGSIGGSIIDYLMATQEMSLQEAIKHFKHELCGIPRSNPDEHKLILLNNLASSHGDLVLKLRNLAPHENYTLDDKGFGRLFADFYKDYCKYNVTAKEWYIFDGQKWVEDTGTMQVSQKAKELVDSLMIFSTTMENERQKSEYQKHIQKLGQFRYRETMIKDARDWYFIRQLDLDSNLDLFNCQNGTLNLKTLDFKEHSAVNSLSKISNVVYDSEAKSEIWEGFISNVMLENIQKIKYLQKVLGYSLTADTSLETACVLWGATTRNGKSTFIETISYMLGNTAGYSMTMQPQSLAQKQNKDSRQASGDIARLNGCRFLSVSEPQKRMIFDTALLIR